MLDDVKATYGYDVKLYKPQTEAVDAYVAANGVNAFYNSVEMRRECCRIRKVEPLGRALASKQQGLGHRPAPRPVHHARELAIEEDDAAHGMTKFNPLADWSEEDVWNYIRANKVPYNALHDQGFPSIGCAPCTRAVQPGEDVRATAGGGKIRTRRNAACTWSTAN
ncbi:phosphoadenosine phosphosulfate reductase family protein [Massilia sp. H-1]|nr:phosphoadenosine phosphosulfate reductase family protein [Massilia sp. H-1]